MYNLRGTYNILAFMENGAMEDEDQQVYGALEENKNFTEQI